MTLEEACRLIDPATDLDALAEIEYYNGFKGKDAAATALHEETIIEILTAFFGKSIAGYSLDTLKHFILRSFEIRSDNSSVRSIAEDVDFIQRAVFARSFGNGRQEVPE